jgi:hypothetical protein
MHKPEENKEEKQKKKGISNLVKKRAVQKTK